MGEYARGEQTRRLARFPLDPETSLLVDGEDGLSRPLMLDDGGWDTCRARRWRAGATS